ncbi:hypothetical protein BGW37DRAFT_519994 [Umbelopsis sp. PMI_123]|nr:hypothetical protein BGW37DRAFT_519994 [Umbelopsis sp. PMI_123]
MSTGNLKDLIEETEDGQLDSIPAPFVSHALSKLAPIYFDQQEYADCELMLADGHFLWTNEFFLTFSSKFFAQVLETKHDQHRLHPNLRLSTNGDVTISIIELPIDPIHRKVLRELMYAMYCQDHFRWLQQLHPAQFAIASHIMETLGIN